MSERYEVLLVSLPTRDRLATSIDNAPSVDRELVFIKATDAAGNVGWGECSALNSRGYTPEWARGAFGILTSGMPVSATSHPMAFAGLEMADLDLRLRADSISLADHMGATRSKIRAGATVGLGTVSETLFKVEALVGQGYLRIKLKIGSGQILDRATALRDQFAGLEIQLDANGSLDEGDLEDLAALSDLDISAIEQPFSNDSKNLTLRLKELVGIPVMADEAIRTPIDLAARGFYDGLVIKPGPVGGLAATAQLIKEATQMGWLISAGGMLESGLGRHYLAALAAGENFGLTGDLSPARRWLKEDPWPDLEMVGGYVTTPTEPGVAPLPDTELLDRLTLAKGLRLRSQ